MINQRSTLLIAFVLIVCVRIATLHAHEMMYRGTIAELQPARISVKVTDDKTKKTETMSFVVNQDTKVKRGVVLVPYGEAHFVIGERIVVIVNHDAETKMLATEIRLAAAK